MSFDGGGEEDATAIDADRFFKDEFRPTGQEDVDVDDDTDADVDSAALPFMLKL